MKSKYNYQEPHWGNTTLMEAMYMKGITSMENSLSFNQMVYVLNLSDVETQMTLDTLVNERFFGKNARGYYLSDLGKFHAKKRIDSFKDSIKEAKGDSERESLMNFILKTRERFLRRIDEARKSSVSKESNPTLEERVAELERKFEKLSKIFSR